MDRSELPGLFKTAGGVGTNAPMGTSAPVGKEAPAEWGLAEGAMRQSQALELRMRMFMGYFMGLPPLDPELPLLPAGDVAAMLRQTRQHQEAIDRVLTALEKMCNRELPVGHA